MTKNFVSAIALIAATPALAQSGPAETIVVTGSRAPGIALDKLGASATVLDAEALQQRQTRVVSDILRDVPGVSVSRLGGVGGLTSVRIRGGEGNHTLVLIDGIEASDPFQGEFDFGSLIADDVARIEVLRGQQSAIYGSDAIGGVVHYITATGAERPGLSARAEYGSFDTASAAARLGGASGGFDYALSGAYNDTGGSPAAVGGVRDLGAESIAASAKLGWAPTPTFRLRAVGRYSRTEADATGLSFATFAPIDGTDSYRARALLGLVRAEVDLLDGRWRHAATAQINDSRRVAFGGSNGDERTAANVGRRIKASYDSTLRIGSEAASHSLTLAADFEREQFRNLPPAFPQPLSIRRRIDNKGLIAEYRFAAGDRLAIGGAVRHDDNDRFGDATTFRASGTVRIAGPLSARAAYGSGLKNPTPFELFGFSNDATVFVGNPNLQPEKSRGWEAGLDLTLPSGVRLGGTYFQSRLKREIFTDFVAGVFTPGNRDTDSTQRGVELFAAARIGETLRIDAAYTYLDAEEDGDEEIRRPPHIASANLAWRPIAPLETTLTVRYNGRTFDSNFTLLPGFGPRVRLDDYTLVNLAADWQLTPQVSLFGRVENLFDEEYTEVFGYEPPGRGAYGGVRVRF